MHARGEYIGLGRVGTGTLGGIFSIFSIFSFFSKLFKLFWVGIIFAGLRIISVVGVIFVFKGLIINSFSTFIVLFGIVSF